MEFNLIIQATDAETSVEGTAAVKRLAVGTIDCRASFACSIARPTAEFRAGQRPAADDGRWRFSPGQGWVLTPFYRNTWRS